MKKIILNSLITVIFIIGLIFGLSFLMSKSSNSEDIDELIPTINDEKKYENVNDKENNNSNNENDSNTGNDIKEETINTTNHDRNNYVSYNGWLDIKDNKLVNQYNELIQLRGISTHGIQWFGDLASKENIKILKDDLNTNLFRIAMYTEEGGYLSNKNIKEDVKKIVNYAIELDMYVIIDWHILSNGDPLVTLNESKIFFEEMSSLYKNKPNVIYELCNEPNNTSWDNNIKPYAEEVIKVIRKNSPKSIIIVGTNTWSQDIQDAVRNPINDNRTMYALHFYSGTHKEWLRDRTKEALKKVPIFVSEWGTSRADGNGGNYFDEADKWVKFMNDNSLSWVNWSLTNKNESSALLKEGCQKITDDCLTTNGEYIKNILKK